MSTPEPPNSSGASGWFARLRERLTARGPCGRRFCRNGCGRGGCNRLDAMLQSTPPAGGGQSADRS